MLAKLNQKSISDDPLERAQRALVIRSVDIAQKLCSDRLEELTTLTPMLKAALKNPDPSRLYSLETRIAFNLRAQALEGLSETLLVCGSLLEDRADLRHFLNPVFGPREHRAVLRLLDNLSEILRISGRPLELELELAHRFDLDEGMILSDLKVAVLRRAEELRTVCRNE